MCRKNGLVERSTHVNQMLNDPSYISEGTLCFAYDKLFVKVIAASIEDIIVAVLYHLRVSRKKEKFIHKKEQKTVVKVCFVGNRTVRINTAIWIYDQYLLSGLFTKQIFYIQLCSSENQLWNARCDYFLVDIQAHVFFVCCI